MQTPAFRFTLHRTVNLQLLPLKHLGQTYASISDDDYPTQELITFLWRPAAHRLLVPTPFFVIPFVSTLYRQFEVCGFLSPSRPSKLKLTMDFRSHVVSLTSRFVNGRFVICPTSARASSLGNMEAYGQQWNTLQKQIFIAVLYLLFTV